jgi:hypothetical protein
MPATACYSCRNARQKCDRQQPWYVANRKQQAPFLSAWIGPGAHKAKQAPAVRFTERLARTPVNLIAAANLEE